MAPGQECRSRSQKTCVQSLPLPGFAVLTVTQPLRVWVSSSEQCDVWTRCSLSVIVLDSAVKCSAALGLLSLTRGLMCLTLLGKTQMFMGLNFGVFQVQLVGLDEESSEFICRNTFDHPYPTTKLMWIPDTKGVYPDLLATSGDYLRVWRVSKCSVSSQTSRPSPCQLLLATQRYKEQTGWRQQVFQPRRNNW